MTWICKYIEETGGEKESIKAYAHKEVEGEESVEYVADFIIPEDFGEIGAVLVENEHHTEMFLETIVLHGLPHPTHSSQPLQIHCASWVHSKFDNPTKRVFFTNKVHYLYFQPFINYISIDK